MAHDVGGEVCLDSCQFAQFFEFFVIDSQADSVLLVGFSSVADDGKQVVAFGALSYGQMYLRDMAYGYNNDAYIANLSYGCYLFDDNRAYFTFRYGVSAGNVTWDNDEFVPD